jgi:hypothetical protein
LWTTTPRTTTARVLDETISRGALTVHRLFMATQGKAHALKHALDFVRDIAGVVAFTDDDVLHSPQWLGELWHGFDDPAVMGIGGRILSRWPASLPKPTWYRESLHSVIIQFDQGNTRKRLTTPPWGPNMAYRLGGLVPSTQTWARSARPTAWVWMLSSVSASWTVDSASTTSRVCGRLPSGLSRAGHEAILPPLALRAWEVRGEVQRVHWLSHPGRAQVLHQDAHQGHGRVDAQLGSVTFPLQARVHSHVGQDRGGVSESMIVATKTMTALVASLLRYATETRCESTRETLAHSTPALEGPREGQKTSGLESRPGDHGSRHERAHPRSQRIQHHRSITRSPDPPAAGATAGL